jgi:hypothetical protein
MRNNLMFGNIPENSSEICEKVIKQLIRTDLETDLTQIKIERAHRNPAIAGPQTKKPRLVVVNFHNYTDRERIMTAASDKGSEIRNKGIGVGPPAPERS